jgi:hypothetical protein
MKKGRRKGEKSGRSRIRKRKQYEGAKKKNTHTHKNEKR